MKKKLLKSIGALLVVGAAYYGAVEFWVWKWESPHDPLPQGHLSERSSLTYDEAYTNLARQVNAEMVNLATELQSVSMSGAVSIGGNLSWAGTVGLAKVENQTPATIFSRYRIGSISKSLTATALARMVELNMIDLDAEVQSYISDYPRYKTPMTVRHLASHMAGVRHYDFDLTLFPPHDFYLNQHFDDVSDAVEHFKDDDVLFSPGLGFSYSTYGYTLLSAVMQEAAERPFVQIMDDLVFTPLGMGATEIEDSSAELSDVVDFYTSDNGFFGRTPTADLSIKYAGGGFLSTPSDLVRLGGALLKDQFITAATRQMFFEPQPMLDGSANPQGYALGWRRDETINILGEDNPVDVVHHGGSSAGGVAFLLLVPDYNISIALLSNGRGDETRSELQMLAYRIAALVIAEQQ